MSTSTVEVDPRYPIGRHRSTATITATDLKAAVATIADLPLRLREAMNDFSEA